MKKSTNRLTIGVLINNLEGRYQDQVRQGIVNAAKNLNVNLLFFVGKSYDSPIEGESQYNIVYDLVSSDKLDGILISSTLAPYSNNKRFREICSRFKPLPMVTIGVKFPDTPAILIDNKIGMEEAISHLITKHNLRNIAFITGPKKHPEAEARLEAYKSVLESFNIPINKDLIVEGDFSYLSGQRAARILLEERNVEIEALVSANDEMLYAAYPLFQERGIRVPEDIAMCGFDDIEEMKFLIPPFSSVIQPFYEQGESALKIIKKIIHGKSAPMTTILPSRFIQRESCGCVFTPETNNDIILNSTDKALIQPEKNIPDNKLFIKSLVSLFVDIEPQQKQQITRFVKTIIDFLNSYTEEIANEEFYRIIGKAANWTLSNYISIKPWFMILFTIEQSYSDPQIELRELFQGAQIVVKDAMERLKGLQKKEYDSLIWDLLNFIRTTNSAVNMKSLVILIEELLPKMSLTNYSMAFYCNSKGDIKTGGKTISNYSKIISSCKDGQILTDDTDPTIIRSRELFEQKYYSDNNHMASAVYPLINREEKFGFIVLGLCPRNPTIYEGVSAQISSVLHTIRLFDLNEATMAKLRSALNELDDFNQKLHSISLHDDLTGVYNRRGFYVNAGKYYNKAVKEELDFLMFFIDLDGLKIINDTYGHNEGDIAIKAVTSVLAKSFRGGDIIGRIGGDEFVVIAKESDQENINCIKERISMYVKYYNDESKKPYPLSVSCGVSIFSPENQTSFESLLSRADENLYTNKNNKKANKMGIYSLK
ncbi:MAG: diguanylate cyclase [bacterium]